MCTRKLISPFFSAFWPCSSVFNNCRFVHKLALKLFGGDVHQAAFRILTDFRKGKFGWFSLERPPR